MRILFVTYYYPPEAGAAAICTSELAQRLATMGHQVSVLTTYPNYPTGIIPAAYRGGRLKTEVIAGVTVLRVWSMIIPGTRPARRLLGQLTFGLLAGWLGARRVGEQDVVIVESPPLFTAIAGRWLAHRTRCPYIFTVSDLWPEAAIQLGALRNRFAIRLAERLERTTYARALGIRTVTSGLQSALEGRGVPTARIFTVPHGVDTVRFGPLPQRSARANLGWDDRFTVLYAGTIGQVQGLHTLLGAAEVLRDRADIRFVLCGDGAAKEALQTKAASRELSNVTFLPTQPHSAIPELLAGADVCFSSLRDLPVFEATLPIKLFEAMACAKPIVLAATDGLASQVFVSQAQAGVRVEPERPDLLAQAIVNLHAHPAQALQLGQQGYAYVKKHFDRDLLAVEVEKQLQLRLAPPHQAATLLPIPPMPAQV